jgi:hypothetical protein
MRFSFHRNMQERSHLQIHIYILKLGILYIYIWEIPSKYRDTSFQKRRKKARAVLYNVIAQHKYNIYFYTLA